MSSYYIFDEAEALLTSTTTAAILGSTDTMIVHNNATNKKFQAPVGAIEAQGFVTVTATTNSSGTNIQPYGVTQLVFAAATALTSFAWQLADPPSAGICKTLIQSTTTSTQNQVNFVSATGRSTDGQALVSVGFSNVGTPYFELQSLSTSVWAVVGRSSAGTHSS